MAMIKGICMMKYINLKNALIIHEENTKEMNVY